MSRIRSLQHDYTLVLSPVRRVPAEIVMEILHHTCTAVDDPEETHVSRFNVCNVAEGLWYLGKVCRPLSVHSAPGYGRHLNGDLVRMLQRTLESTDKHPLDFMFSHCSTSPAENYRAPLLRHYNESFRAMETSQICSSSVLSFTSFCLSRKG